MYVNNALSHHRREGITDPKLEILGIEVTPKHAKAFVILCWYRPPTPDIDNCSFEALARIIRKIDAESKEIILIGDTNCYFKSPKDGNSRRLKLIYSEFQFEQQITEYTRVATYTNAQGEAKITKSLVDHFSTNRPNHISDCGVIKLGITDHYVIYGVRKLHAKPNRRGEQRVPMINYDI